MQLRAGPALFMADESSCPPGVLVECVGRGTASSHGTVQCIETSQRAPG